MPVPKAAVAGGLVLLAGVAAWLVTAPPAPGPGAPAAPGAAPAAFPAGTPGAAVERYVDGDYAGDRLEKAAWERYKTMVAWKAEPTWEEAFVIRPPRLAMGRRTTASATVEVTYEVIGALSLETFAYEASPSRQTVPFDLFPDGRGGWTIALPIIRPHVSPAAAIAYLGRMRAQYKSRVGAIDASIAALEALR